MIQGRRAWGAWILAAGFYVGVTLVQTWPLALRLPRVLPHDLGDPLLNAWILWWNAHTIPFTSAWWNAPAFWPSSGALAFSEVLLGFTPLTSPIQWLGGSAITAYNVAFLLTFPLSALAAHALVFRLTRRHDAGIVAGLIFGFNPFRVAHFPQIQVLASFWMPVALLALHEYVATRRGRWLWAFGAAWLMQALSNGYYLLFFPVLLGVWMLWFAFSRSTLGTFRAMVTAFVVASLPLMPLLWTYRRIHSALSFQRGAGEVATFGADVASLVDTSPLLAFWQLHAFHRPEGELFPGFTAAALVLALALHWLWTTNRGLKLPRTAILLLLGSAVFTAVALSARIAGPWSIGFGRTTLVSVRVASKPLSAGVLLFAAGVAFLPGMSGAWRRRSMLMFYALATGLMYLLCFGPQPHFLGVPFMYRGPYRLLMALPGYDAIRVPARFAMLAVLCVSVVAALGFARMTTAIGRIGRLTIAAIVICGVLVDSAVGEMPLKDLPPRFTSFESLPAGTAVVEIPVGDLIDDVAAMYRGMYHGRPVINGYSGFFPRSYVVLQRGLRNRDPEIFDALASHGPIVVVVDTARDPEAAWATQAAVRPGTRMLGEQFGWKAFVLAKSEPRPGTALTERLPVEVAAASVNNDRMPLALDGDDTTRWNSNPQEGNETITIDLGVEYDLDAITMTLGPQMADFPRRLVIETSSDTRDWTARWEGTTAGIALEASLRDPRDIPLTFPLGHHPARWIRLRQVGQDDVFYWSIFELRIYGR